jgi:hypothetical protein
LIGKASRSKAGQDKTLFAPLRMEKQSLRL